MNQKVTELELTIIIGNYVTGDRDEALLAIRHLNKIDMLRLITKWSTMMSENPLQIIGMVIMAIN